MTVGQALSQSGLVPIDAQVLLVHVLARDRAWLAAHRDDTLSRAQADAFFALARRRRDGEPVAYLTGVREFWGMPLRVTPDVLIPRPETETLVELVLEWLPKERPVRVLDVGTGSGAIALAIAKSRPEAHVLAIDVSPAALAVARGNAQALGLANVDFVESDFYANVRDAVFDAIASNPPYVRAGDPHLAEGDVRYEPTSALVPRGDELAALRAVIDGAPPRLVPGGAVAVEHGYAQSGAVQDLLRAAGLAGITVRRDLAGIPRVAAGRSG